MQKKKIETFFSFQKVELRIAERKAKDNKEHMTYLRQMAKEEREKREALEKEIEGRSDNLAKLQTEKEAAIRTRDDLVEQVKRIRYDSRLYSLNYVYFVEYSLRKITNF
jgi:C4-dicarboxylate-specific signal transduction histidine kinase